MKLFAAFLITVCSLSQLFGSQEPKRITRTFSMDNAVVIREVGAVITTKEEKLIVEVILGNNEKESSEISKDDIILMANGKKIKSIKDLREQYESAKVGDEFKLGLKRGENLLIAAFTKKSEEELNKMGGGRMMMRMEKNDGEEVLPALGLVFGTKNNKVSVVNTLPTAERNFKSFLPKQGDIIVSINNKDVKSAEEFAKAYDTYEEGEKVTIIFLRDGKESSETFSKPKPQGRMIIKN